jgi:ABC-type transport system involved in cytochrome c biogenesis permease component
MRFLPIVERELRVASRRGATYWLRSWVALSVILVCGGVVLFTFHDSPHELARALFYTLTGGALFLCLLAGMRSTADCLSEEKREGTLGLLFLTNLKGHDVVLGKLAASSLNGFYGLLAILPVMAIPLLLGGLTLGEFARVAVVLVNTLFFSMCLGMFASALSRSTRKAIGITLLLILLFTLACPACGSWLRWKYHWYGLERLLALPSAGYSYAMALDRSFKTGPKAFYGSVGVVHLLAWIFLWLACLIVPRSWQDRPLSVPGERWRAWWRFSSCGSEPEQMAFRTRLLDRNPFFWLVARARLKPLWLWIFLSGTACVWVWGAMKFHKDWFNEGIYIATAFVLNSTLKNWFAAEAVRQLSEDRHLGTIELLLSTPLSIQDILRGQALAMRRQFFGPVVLTLAAEIVMLFAGPSVPLAGDDRYAWVSGWVAVMIMLPADLIALYWVGMWMGLAAKNPKRAFSDTVGRVLAVPWTAFAVFITVIAFLGPDINWKPVLGVWFALGLAVDIGFGVWARWKLLLEFREMATRRYERRVSWWNRLFGKSVEASEA